jgi:hypothetical protein
VAVELVDAEVSIPAATVTWVGKDLVRAEFDLSGVVPNTYDVRLFNPGGGTAEIAGAFTVHERPTGLGDYPPAERKLAFGLGRNIPNPFNPSTVIPFEIAKTAWVILDVYDVAGRHLRRLASGEFEPGRHFRKWDGRDEDGTSLSSGVYFCRMLVDGSCYQQKMLMLR